jgi:hypothetical protein
MIAERERMTVRWGGSGKIEGSATNRGPTDGGGMVEKWESVDQQRRARELWGGAQELVGSAVVADCSPDFPCPGRDAKCASWPSLSGRKRDHRPPCRRGSMGSGTRETSAAWCVGSLATSATGLLAVGKITIKARNTVCGRRRREGAGKGPSASASFGKPRWFALPRVAFGGGTLPIYSSFGLGIFPASSSVCSLRPPGKPALSLDFLLVLVETQSSQSCRLRKSRRRWRSAGKWRAPGVA